MSTYLFPSQQSRLDAVLAIHPESVVIRTSDERTGKRFGLAAKRVGQCQKIGSGGRNKGQVGYQLWASWAPCDIKKIF